MAVIVFNGVQGQVGGSLFELVKNDTQHTWFGVTSSECDLTNPEQIDNVFLKYQPDYFIQIAAYTAVDKAEEDKDTAFKVNAISTRRIAKLCKKYGSKMIYVSSDYVYNSIQDRPILETDTCNPQGQYALSKYEGEQLIRAILPEHVILRTSWVYNKTGHNFVNSMIRLGENRDSLTIVADQFGAPTFAPDIAQALLTIIENIENKPDTNLYGTYNFANSGVTNWADFAKAIFEIKQIPCTVSHQTTEQFGAPAPRPKWSVLSTDKFRNTFNVEIRSWQNCLKECLSE